MSADVRILVARTGVVRLVIARRLVRRGVRGLVGVDDVAGLRFVRGRGAGAEIGRISRAGRRRCSMPRCHEVFGRGGGKQGGVGADREECPPLGVLGRCGRAVGDEHPAGFSVLLRGAEDLVEGLKVFRGVRLGPEHRGHG